MKISLIFPPANFLISQMVNPPLGIGYLSAYLKKYGYQDVSIYHIVDNKIPDIESDIIGISFTTPQFPAAVKVLQELKKTNPNSLFVAGGPHATACPKDVLGCGFDVVVVGEGEEALLDVVRKRERGDNIEPIMRGSEIVDIDTIPFPDYDAIDIGEYKWISKDGKRFISMVTNRGCPMRCRYCASPVMWKHLRSNSVDYVKAHIDLLKKKHHFDGIAFQDDVFTYDKKRMVCVTEHLKEKGIAFRCLARANLLDKERVKILTDNGCIEVCIGIESGNQEMLDVMNKRTTVEQNRQAILNCKEVGLSVKCFVLLGVPGESEESIKDTMSLLDETKPDDIDVNVMVLYPGTEFYIHMGDYDIRQEIKDYDMQYLKGRIGDYHPTISTSKITADRLEYYRKLISNRFSRLVKT
jgi:radical SAM superfamily enzyme YgiQ (UPF0313 family)